MSANLLERVTPGPWVLSDTHPKKSCLYIDGANERLKFGDVASVYRSAVNGDDSQNEANAELIALAYDHALFLRALTMGVVRWFADLPGDTTIVFGNGRCMSAPDKDVAGCPALTPELREALRRAIGIEAANG